tara:strand:+ start:924 stop:1238 length:315 start_codon:yes stop_codon:yes gene_type:complete
MERPKVQELDRPERFTRYGHRVEGAERSGKFITDVLPYFKKFDRPKFERSETEVKIGDRDRKRWEPDEEGQEKKFESKSMRKRYTDKAKGKEFINQFISRRDLN